MLPRIQSYLQGLHISSIIISDVLFYLDKYIVIKQIDTVVPRQTGPTDNRTPRITVPGFSGTAPR